MELVGILLGSWLALSFLVLVGTAAVCRAGHAEDVARGFADDGADLQHHRRSQVWVPSPRAEQAGEGTHG